MEIFFEPKDIKDIVKLLSFYAETYHFIFNQHQLKFYSVNNKFFSYVCFNSNNFDKFKWKSNITAGIDINDLLYILKSYDNNNIIIFEIDEKNPYELHIKQEDIYNSSSLNSTIKLFDMDDNNNTNFNIDYDVSIELDTFHLLKLLKYISNDNNCAYINISDKNFILSYNNKECKKKIDIDYNFQKKININDFKTITKFNNISKYIKLYLKNNLPIITELNNKYGIIRVAFNDY